MVSAHALAQKGLSVYTERPRDPKAIYFTKENFNVSGDGRGDDAPALQAAIDEAIEKSGQGIVFIPEGSYRLGKTIRLWRGVRLIGYGAERPTFTLANNSPGFQEGDYKYMIQFCKRISKGQIPKSGSMQTLSYFDGTWQVTKDFEFTGENNWETTKFFDGNWGTFYSGIDNINFQIGKDNPAVIAVRYHIAQVCFLRNIDFNIGEGRGAVENMGNIIENCTFRGGDYGIKTKASPPHWQCMVLDCTFEGQRSAGLITEGARMLVIRSKFNHSPVGILLPAKDKLYVRDSWFMNIHQTALQVNDFVSPELQVNLNNLKFSGVPYSVRFRGRAQGWSADELKLDYEAPSQVFEIKNFSHGLHLEMEDGIKKEAKFETNIDQQALTSLGKFPESDIPSLPDQKEWVNILELGAVGDGATDNTEVLIKAIAKHNALYFPIGKYLVSGTLALRGTTRLIGFHPDETQIILKEYTTGFSDATNPQAVIIAPNGGSNIISGIGFNFGNNPGLIGIKWMAGSNSCINDGVFDGMYGANPTKEAHLHTIWVTNGGGGIFKNFWINDVRSQLAFFINNTNTPGNIYEISIEHHQQDFEVKLDNVTNWSFYALQIEEDRWAEKTSGISMTDCKNILFANFVSHRTTGVWEPCFTAMQTRNTTNLSIQGIEIRGAMFPFENALFDELTGVSIPYPYFTKLVVK
jgi:hypothetical protein